MEQESHSTEAEKKTLDERVLTLIKTDISRELETQQAPLDQQYLARLEEFWKALNALFGTDPALREEYKKKYPGLARFTSIDQFREFYANAVLSKINELAETGRMSDAFKKQLIHIKKRLKEEKTAYNFFIPFTEVERRDRSHNILAGGLHTDATFFTTDGKTAESRHKHFALAKEYELEQLCLGALSALGHEVPKPESASQQLFILSTPMYQRDFRYLLKTDESGAYVHAEDEREKRAKEAISILIPAVLDLTAYKNGKLTVPKETGNDLDKFLKHKEHFIENANRFGFSENGFLEKFLAEAAKTCGVKLENSRHLDHLIEKYNSFVFAQKIANRPLFLVHGDAFAGNMLEDFDGRMAITDFTPFEAPITWDLYSVIEFLALGPESRDRVLKHAATQIFRGAKRRGMNPYGSGSPSVNEEEYHKYLKHEYQWMSLHRSLEAAGTMLRLKRNDPNAKLPDPSHFYSIALKTLDKLGEESPEYFELGALLRRYVSTAFRKDGAELLKETEVNGIDLSYLHENRQASLTAEAVSGLEDVLGVRKPRGVAAEMLRNARTGVPGGVMCDLTAETGELTPEEREEAGKILSEAAQRRKAERMAGDEAPIIPSNNQFCTPQERLEQSLMEEARRELREKYLCAGIMFDAVKDAGKNYQVRIPKTIAGSEMPLEGLKAELERIKSEKFALLEEEKIEKFYGDVEFSVRGKELHVINHRENTRYKIDTSKDNLERTEYKVVTGPFTDRRRTEDVAQELQTKHGTDKITVETLEDRAVFKKKGLFGTKTVDEILFDNADPILQMLKYMNTEFRKGKKWITPSKLEAKKDGANYMAPVWPDDQTNDPYGGAGLLNHRIELLDKREIPLPIEAKAVLRKHVKEIVGPEGLGSLNPKKTTEWLEKKLDANNYWVEIENGKAYYNIIDHLGAECSFPVKLAKNPFALRTPEGKIVSYEIRDGLSNLTSPDELRTRWIDWQNRAGKYVGTFFATAGAGFAASGGDLKMAGTLAAGGALAYLISAGGMFKKNGRQE